MADQNKKFDMEENIEIDLNKQIDLTKYVFSLQCENFSLWKKIDKLEATHRVELEAKETEIRGLRRHLEEVDSQWKSQKDLHGMPKEELARRQVNELQGIVDKSEATCRIELQAKETEIRGLMRHLEELDSQWKIQKVLLCMAKDDAERQVNELLSKVDKLEATHRIELEGKEREISGLRWNLDELDNHWKRQKDLLCMAKNELAERRINELLTKVSELENRLANSQRLIDENEQVGESSSVNVHY